MSRRSRRPKHPSFKGKKKRSPWRTLRDAKPDGFTATIEMPVRIVNARVEDLPELVSDHLRMMRGTDG